MSVNLETENGKLDLDAANAVLDEFSEREAEREPEKETLRPGEDDKKAPAKDDAPAPSDDEQEDSDDWTTAADLAELVESLGLSEEDLAEFGSREELDRHVKLLDKQLIRAGKEALAKPGEEQEAALRAQAEAERRAEASERAKQQPRKDGRFAKTEEAEEPDESLTLDEDYFDERLVAVHKQTVSRLQQLEARLRVFEQRDTEAQQREIVRTFDRIVDTLGHDDIFGKSAELAPGTDAWKNRSGLYETTTELIAGAIANGKRVGMVESIVRRALNQRFADQLSKKQRQDFASKVRKQASRTLGASQRNRPGKYDGPLEKDPELLELYRQLEKESGG